MADNSRPKNKKSDWRTFGDVRATFGSADRVDNLIIFNVGGNKYRALAEVLFHANSAATVLIRIVLVHKEYDKLDLG